VTFNVPGQGPTDVPLSGGQAILQVTGLAVGTDTVTAHYSGDADYAASGASRDITVNPVQTTVTVTLSANPTTVGSPPTATVTVSPGAATGTVDVSIVGVQDLGPVTLSGGTATVQLPDLPTNSYVVDAAYGGDGTYGASDGQAAWVVS
jgi:hypothetical protein